MKKDERKTKAELIAELNELRGSMEDTDSALLPCDVVTDRFRQIVDGLPQFVYEIDLTGRLTYANDYAYEAFGFTKKDLAKGLNILKVIHPDSQARVQANIARSLGGTGSVGEEYLAIRKDGATFPIKVYSQAIFENGHPVSVRGVAIDISDVKQAEEALKKSEDYYRTLFENTGTAMAIFGEDSIIRSCNSHFEELSGYSPDEVEGHKKWSDFVPPEDVEKIAKQHEIQRLEDSNVQNTYETSFVTHDGTHKQVQVFIQLIPDTKDRVCSLIDVTERRESEARFMTVFEQAAVGITLASMDGVWLEANPAMCEITGYSHDELIGKRIADITHPYDRGSDRELMLQLKNGKVDQMNTEKRYIHKQGHTVWVSLAVTTRKDANGNPLYFQAVISDITERKKTEQDLLESESFYRTLFENTGTAMLIFGQDSVIRSCNTKCAELSGYSAEEVEGKMKWTDFVEPEDLKEMVAYHAKRTQEGHKPPSDYEFTFVPREGEHKRVHNFVKIIPGTENRVCSLIDITDREKVETALRESETYYRTLFANTGTAMVIFGQDSIIRSCNAKYEELSGYMSKEVEGKMKWSDFVDPEELKRMAEYHAKRVEEGHDAPNNYEFNFLARNGERKRVHTFIQVIPETQDRVCSLIDITDRKVTEQALRESEERFRDIFENAGDGVYQCNPQGEFITANPSIAHILGYDSPADLIQSVKNIETQCYVNPEDRVKFLADLKVAGSLSQYELHLQRKDGKKIWASENVRAVYDDQGKLIFYEGFVQDITERKLNERTTHALYAISKAISTTRDLQALYEAIHSILGEVIDATNFFIAIHNEEEDRLVFTYFADEIDDYYDIRNVSDPETRSLTIQVLRTGEPLFISQANPIDLELQKNIGVVGTPAEVWLGVPLKLGDKVIGCMTVQHYSNPHHYSDTDVVLLEAVSEQVAMAIERKTNEEAVAQLNEELEDKVDQRTSELRAKAAELETANKRLRELDEIKSSLVSSISHELRTPLTSIRGFAKLTGKDFVRHFQPLTSEKKLMKKGERIRQNLEIIETEGERLTRLINDFLDINRIESGKATWNDRFLNPCEVIRQAADAVAGSFAAKEEVDLIIDLPETIPPIHADPDKIQQVLINLLNNAYKFTNEGSVTITIKSDERTLSVSVIDTGMGISETEQPYIFEKFHKSKLGDTIRTKDKGTGLGLAICREIAEHYGGTIWVESTPGKGSAFSFMIPVVPGTETACS